MVTDKSIVSPSRKGIKMSAKETYVITVKCKMCNFQVSQEVEIEPENLTKTKTELVKRTASIHPKHGDVDNFVVF